MSSCLGLYIEENLIKYAKVTKEREDIKVESFGVKFYDNIGKAIEQIIAETYSYKIPISINLSEETYNYFYFFNLLNKNDLKKAIETEFESYCFEKSYNRNALETRYVLVPDMTDKEKIKAIYIYTNKVEVNRKIQELENYSVSNISSLPMSIVNLIQANSNENSIIINLEEKTTLTTIIEGQVYNVDVLKDSLKDVLDKINEKENSYSKAYEICKNTTIYTIEGKELQEEENLYLQEIMPTLYSIVTETKQLIENSLNKIDKIYITGTGSIINNIDLYFQEYLDETKCEILRPDFVTNIRDINIKDYIEVNSAISMALMGLGEGIQGINFKNQSLRDKMPGWLNIDRKTTEKAEKKSKFNLKLNLHEKLDVMEKNLLRGTYSLLIFMIIYGIFAAMLNGQLENKQTQANERKSQIQEQISKAQADNSRIQSATNGYTSAIQELQKLNNIASENLKTRNMIPNLLNQIMSIVPENVQITSIQNPNDRHIQIQAQSNKYEQLGYLKAKLKTEQILTNVISSAGQKNGDVVIVTIEGDLS